MPQPLRIALLLFAAAGIAGFVIYTLVGAVKRSEDPAKLIFKWILTLVVVGTLFWFARSNVNSQAGAFMVPLACVVVAVILTPIWAPSIGRTLASPITSMFDGGSEELDPAPLYSTAEALRKRGKCREAIYAIQEQLRKFPHDFTGQMMLAEIQAENLNDVQAAEITIHRLCEQPKHAPASLAFALNSLADWHMKYSQDTEAAQAELERIVALFPDSEFARTAANRIAHLAKPEMLIRQRESETVTMKHGVEYLGLLKDQSHLLPKEKQFKEEAVDLAAHLEAHPLDHEARERLAVIYARHYGRLDLATDQLEQLIALPGESPKHVARWLNVLANLQVEVTNKTDLAEQTLRRIIDLFPNQSHAALAEQRLGSIALEVKRYEKSRVVKFGAKEDAGQP